ncbi:Rid family hydrolase [uncultured Tateyamaria sp.]|uniref:RidA family protein n=1 Tax=uncultured Tateyamaria sp. TaxID=455651 RepID=UPI002612913D|nr:Rid family hydrolase [uncultured Tateyamaria sp.]
MKELWTFSLAALLACSGAAFAEDARTGIYPAGNVPIAPYSPGIKTANGFLYVSGQIAYIGGEIPEHARDGENDVQDQTKIVMENIKSVMAEAGYDFNDAVRATVFITDMDNYGAFNEIYGTYWGADEMPPARAAVEVGALPGGKPGAPVLVEVSMIAYK